MGDPRGTRADVIDASEFQLDLQLQPKELPGYMFVMTLFYVVFTITFYVGIRIETVYEVMGTSSKSEALMDTYNTYSGYVMALVAVLLSMYAGKFVPVLEVLTNSSIKSLQAVQVTTGVKRVMTVDDMKKEMSVIEQIKVKSKKDAARSTNAKDTILINAIRQNATPFTFETDSPCGQDTEDGGGASDWVLNAHEMGSTSAIYGFIPREWNSEALIEPTQTSTYTVSYAEAADAFQGNVSLPAPEKFSLKTAYEMLVQGKMVIESAFGNSVIGSYKCWLSDGLGANGVSPSSVSGPNTTAVPSPDIDVFVDDSQNQWTVVNNSRVCEGGVSSMFQMSNFYSRDVFRAEDLVRDAADTISVTIPDIARDETSITLATYDLTPQIHLEVMQIELIMNKTVVYGNQTSCPASDSSCETKYSYAPFQKTFCGSNRCAFLDTSGSFPIQPEIGVLPYYVNCTLDRERIHYSADFRGYFPDVCTKAKYASFLYGYGSYMAGNAFGSHDSDTNASYIVAPRRRITFTFAKVVWELKNLDKEYNAYCGHVSLDTNASAVNCAGLAYQLQPSGRFLFAGKAALPNDVLRGTSFRSPIPLVQLNSPTVEVDGKLATIERLDPQNFAFYISSRLEGNKCFLVMDSYLKHVDGNNYFLERPLQTMATSFFYFLMENAAVTDLKNVSLVLDKKTVNKTATIDRLGNVRLKGDLQLRNILVSIPWDSFRTTIVGCVGICIGTTVIICVPARRVKHCTENTTRTEQFVAMDKDADYPDDVHDKLFVFPAAGERVRFADLVIEALALAHISLSKATLSKSIQKKNSEQSESESDVSHASTLDEIT